MTPLVFLRRAAGAEIIPSDLLPLLPRDVDLGLHVCPKRAPHIASRDIVDVLKDVLLDLAQLTLAHVSPELLVRDLNNSLPVYNTYQNG